MKKTIAMLLAVLTILLAAACAPKQTDPEQTKGGSTSEEATKDQTKEDGKDENPKEDPEEDPTEAFDPATWGVEERMSARVDDDAGFFMVHMPKHGGLSKGNGLIGQQQDGTVALISGQNAKSPQIQQLSELLPAYGEHLTYTMVKMYGLITDNYVVDVESDEAVTVNGYDMHRFEGKISFDFDGVPTEYQYVAYATVLESNGGYAYWVVYDDTEDQSKGELIAEHAYHMAQTFKEDP